MCEHAGLHDVGADVGQHGLKLLANHVRRHRLNSAHAPCILGSNRGDDRAAVNPERGKRFQVGLNTSAAT